LIDLYAAAGAPVWEPAPPVPVLYDREGAPSIVVEQKAARLIECSSTVGQLTRANVADLEPAGLAEGHRGLARAAAGG